MPREKAAKRFRFRKPTPFFWGEAGTKLVWESEAEWVENGITYHNLKRGTLGACRIEESRLVRARGKG